MTYDKELIVGINPIHKMCFSDLSDIAYHVSHAEVNEKVFDTLASIKSNIDNWSGTDTFEEAVKLCEYGDYNNLDMFLEKSASLENAMPKVSQKRNVVSKVYGFRPNVNEYLTGNPNCMRYLVRNEPYKFVEIFFNIASGWKTSANQLSYRGIITINLIKFLESLGYRVKLNFFELCYEEGKSAREYFYTSTNIKKESEVLDASSCYFPMCNPAYFRRILFRVLETAPVKTSYWGASYGKVVDAEDTKAVLDLGDDSLIISDPMCMGIEGFNIYEDANNFFNELGIDKYLGDNQELEFSTTEKNFKLRRKR